MNKGLLCSPLNLSRLVWTKISSMIKGSLEVTLQSHTAVSHCIAMLHWHCLSRCMVITLPESVYQRAFLAAWYDAGMTLVWHWYDTGVTAGLG